MTEPVTDRLADADSGAGADPPLTGDPAIDEALAAMGDLTATSLPEHHDRLARAHEVLHGALEREDEPDEPG